MDQAAPDTSGQTRRDIIKKGAIAGGAAIWAVPVVQTISAGSAGAASVPPVCVAGVTPPAGTPCSSTPGAFNGQIGLGGGQFRAVRVGATNDFTISWPVTLSCAGSGCSQTVTWAWQDMGTQTYRNCANANQMFGVNNTALIGPFNQSTVILRVTNCALPFGLNIRAQVTVQCGTSSATAFRQERVRNSTGCSASFSETFLPLVQT